MNNIPNQPPNSFRIILHVTADRPRIDNVLLEALRKQETNLDLKIISRAKLKELFQSSKIQIKGQRAKPSSTLAVGDTYVDILGFAQ